MTREEFKELDDRIRRERPLVWLAMEVGCRVVAIAVFVAILSVISTIGFIIANLIVVLL